MENKGNIIRFKKRKTINLGLIIFLIIFIYIVAYIIFYLTKDHLSIYEVQRESLATENKATGVIIREETIVYTDKTGYINYYIRDGARVKKNTTIYSIDENKTIYETLLNSSDMVKFSDNDINEIKYQITSYQKKFSYDDYSSLTALKEDLTGSILTLIDLNLMDQLMSVIEKNGVTPSFNTVKTNESGIISYHVDSLDGLKSEDVNTQTFFMEDFSDSSTRTSDLNGEGSKVYKLISNENWEVIVPVSQLIYNSLAEMSSVKINILDDGFVTAVPVSVYVSGSEYYAKLSFDKYMVRYKNKRFLEIEFLLTSEMGLKIPVTSIITKEFFKIPKNFLTTGGNSNETGVIVKTYDTENGAPIFNFIPTEIYYEDEEYAYVSTDLFDLNTFLSEPETDTEFRVTLYGKLEGVFNVNKGYAMFRRIERIMENEEYVIVKEDTPKGIALYDHIALDADTAVESKIIF